MHIESFGAGPDLVMLHGWSMHSGVWREWAQQLAALNTVHLVDLPGHGQSTWQTGDLELETVLQQLEASLPANAIWLGWSLGGLISLALASRNPRQVNKLILLAATPLFVAKEDWPCAVQADIFEQFASSLDGDQNQTLKRFLMLQARGAKQSRETIRAMSERLATEHTPVPEALHAGLNLLLHIDLREQLAGLHCPLYLLLGDRDTLIPVTMVEQAKTIKPDLSYAIIEGAGHAPFISHPDLCRQQIEHFIHG